MHRDNEERGLSVDVAGWKEAGDDWEMHRCQAHVGSSTNGGAIGKALRLPGTRLDHACRGGSCQGLVLNSTGCQLLACVGLQSGFSKNKLATQTLLLEQGGMKR